MFAVLKTGGKQYKVQPGDVLRVERLAADAGEKVQFNEVLMLGGESLVIGAPLVAGAAVQAEVVDQVKGDKVISFVKRRRKHGSQRTRGHRQKLTLVRVTDILASGAEATGVKVAIGTGSVRSAVSAPARSDDLKRLSGVGPALEKKLHTSGVTSFAQIAAWTPEDVATFNEKLNFKGRIEREGWIDQARDLAKG